MEAKSAIGYLLCHLASVLGRHSDQVLQEQLGIGMSQFKILLMLQWNPHIKQRRLAEHLGQTEASISRQIKIMLQKGMLTTHIDPQNRRARITTATAKGVKITEAAQEALVHHHRPIFECLGQKQQKQLLEMLRTLHAYTCQPGKTTACDHPLNT